MPYVRKSAKKSVKRYRRSPTAVSTIRRVAKQVMLKQVETKRHLQASGTIGLSNVIMPDNVSRWLISNCMNLTQGTEENHGIGSEILASGISLKVQFKYTQPWAPYFKLFVVEANEALLGGSNTIFENAVSNGMLDNIRKQYKVLKSIVVNPMVRGMQNTGTSHASPPIFRKLWIPLKRKYDFRGDNMTNGVSKNIAVIAIAYHDGLPANLDVGTISCYSTLYYKDP